MFVNQTQIVPSLCTTLPSTVLRRRNMLNDYAAIQNRIHWMDFFTMAFIAKRMSHE